MWVLTLPLGLLTIAWLDAQLEWHERRTAAAKPVPDPLLRWIPAAHGDVSQPISVMLYLSWLEAVWWLAQHSWHPSMLWEDAVWCFLVGYVWRTWLICAVPIGAPADQTHPLRDACIEELFLRKSRAAPLQRDLFVSGHMLNLVLHGLFMNWQGWTWLWILGSVVYMLMGRIHYSYDLVLGAGVACASFRWAHTIRRFWEVAHVHSYGLSSLVLLIYFGVTLYQRRQTQTTCQ